MGQLLVRCQECGTLYPSGILTDLESLQKHLHGFSDITTKCSFCGHENVSNPTNMVYTVLA